jgi:hypothetical protein
LLLNNMNDQALQLLDQIIEMAEAQEKELKSAYLALNKASWTVGELALLHYLKVLKELLASQPKTDWDKIALDNKTLHVALG